MDLQLLCDILNPKPHSDDAGVGSETEAAADEHRNLSLFNESAAGEEHAAWKTETAAWDLGMISHWVIIPSLCVMGLLGNSLTVIVLLVRLKEKVETIEKGSIVGMTALAVTDCVFCLITLYGTFPEDTDMVYDNWSLTLYFKLYGNYVQNVLIKTSTYVTVIMALYRLMAVVYAMNAQKVLQPVFPFLGIVCGLIFWVVLQVPLLWIWETREIKCSEGKTFIVLNVGRFEANEVFRETMTYIWAVLGFFVPVSVLAYSNVRLIIQVHITSKQTAGKQVSRQGHRQTMRLKMTTTLIAIIVCFFLFVFPGEFIHFYQEVTPEESTSLHSINTATHISNMLLALNMSFNFILYCIVNSQFRNTLVSLFFTVTCRKAKRQYPRGELGTEQENSLIRQTTTKL